MAATVSVIPDAAARDTLSMSKSNGTLLADLVTESVKMTPLEIWGYGFLFVTLINMSSVMGIVFFPLMNKKMYATVMRIMIGLAIGSLSGSALFHLIPKALKLNEDCLSTLAFVWISIWLVMLLECTMKIGLKTKSRNKKSQDFDDTGTLSKDSYSLQGNNSLSHHSIPELTMTTEEPDDDIDGSNSLVNQIPIYHSTFSLNKHAAKTLREDSENSIKRRPSEDSDSDPKAIKTVAWVIIFGDALHNFIDGVSIGAAFTTSFTTGTVICLAIFCEEFPHELGDFAILINSGLSVKKALLFNFMSALTCYLGLILGILLGEEFDWSNYIFAVAAGIFLYVALGDMVPEVTSIIEEVSDVAPKQAWNVLLVHHCGIFVGISILFILAKYLPG